MGFYFIHALARKAFADLQPAEQDAIKMAVPLLFSESESKPAKR